MQKEAELVEGKTVVAMKGPTHTPNKYVETTLVF